MLQIPLLNPSALSHISFLLLTLLFAGFATKIPPIMDECFLRVTDSLLTASLAKHIPAVSAVLQKPAAVGTSSTLSRLEQSWAQAGGSRDLLVCRVLLWDPTQAGGKGECPFALPPPWGKAPATSCLTVNWSW